MSTITEKTTATPTDVPVAVLLRLLDEGHTTNNWYGADLLTAIDGVDEAAAARRPADGRHNVGEVALHHAYWLHEVGNRLGAPAERFPLEGEDWFEWPARASLSWSDVRDLLRAKLQRLRAIVEAVSAGKAESPLDAAARFDQLLGIAAHAAYHAGQVQLVKKLI